MWMIKSHTMSSQKTPASCIIKRSTAPANSFSLISLYTPNDILVQENDIDNELFLCVSLVLE